MRLVLLLTLTVPSCLYDPGGECGPDQVLTESGECRCFGGMVPDGDDCEPCLEHEHSVGDRCACDPGRERDADGVCVADAGSGEGASPTGQGQPCESHAECAGTQAGYCESLFLHECLAEGCAAPGATPCSAGFVCCDFTAIAGVSLCVEEAALEGGGCPSLW